MKVIKPNEFSATDGSFIRDSTATYVDGGVLKTAAIDEPRFQDGVLLLEGRSTNTIKQTENLTIAPWANVVSGTSTKVDAGSGLTVGKTFLITATSNNGGIRQSVSGLTIGKNYTWSFKLESTASYFAFTLENGPTVYGNSHYTIFNPITGAFSSSSGWVSKTAVKNGNAWDITLVLLPAGGAGTAHLEIRVPLLGETFILSQTQLEPGVIKTSYIPTTTVNVTRSPDVVDSLNRSFVGTYIDDGLLKTAGTDAPRYQDGVLLLEPEGTNLLYYSYGFDNAVWTKTRATVSANVVTGPTGAATSADKLVEDTSTNSHFISQTVSGVPANSPVTCSCFVKAGERSWFAIVTADSAGTFNTTYFNVATGGIGTVAAGHQASIVTVGSGWYRCAVTTQQSATTGNFVFYPSLASADATPSYLGNGTSGLYIDSAQLELSATLTSYMASQATLRTRPADILFSGLIYSTATEVYINWDSVTTYSLGQRVLYNTHIFESLQNSNQNQNPATAATYWLDIGADNRHAALDSKIGTTTEATETFSMIVSSNRVDAITLLNLDTAICTVSVFDLRTYATIYTNTFGTSGTAVNDWYQYFFFDPLSKRTQVVLSGLGALYPNTIIAIKLTGPAGEIVKLGSILVGETEDLGATQYVPKVGIVDYSKKETDEFGTVSVVERPFSKRMSADIYFPNYDLNRIQRFLYSIRAKPVVWIASEDPTYEEALVVYGFYKDFSTTIAYPSHSLCSLEIEGLT